MIFPTADPRIALFSDVKTNQHFRFKVSKGLAIAQSYWVEKAFDLLEMAIETLHKEKADGKAQIAIMSFFTGIEWKHNEEELHLFIRTLVHPESAVSSINPYLFEKKIGLEFSNGHKLEVSPIWHSQHITVDDWESKDFDPISYLELAV